MAARSRVYGQLGDHLLVADGRYVRLGSGEWCWETEINARRPPVSSI